MKDAAPLEKAKRTRWFGRKNLPVRIGFYEIRTNVFKLTRFSYWNGRAWSWFSEEIEAAQRYVDSGTWHHGTKFCWRGLAEKP